MKRILLLLTFLMFPFTAFAYSDKIIVGGETLGISIRTNGVMIVGFYKINGKYNKGKPNLFENDYIIKVNGNDISSLEELTTQIESSNDKRSVKLTILRDNKEKEINLPLIYESGKYKTGLYVKDNIKGIGTLTYIDPETNIYGALGHQIENSSTEDIVEIKEGKIFESYITGIEKSMPAVPGSKLAKFNEYNTFGTIEKNTIYGIFGTYKKQIDGSIVEISDPKVGPATIRTVIENDLVEEFEIEIKSINKSSDTKNLTFIVTDEKLLLKTGGVVQGMSGSPIIQDGKIVGALTHVIVDNPTMGYGVLIKSMLEEGEKSD